MDEIYARTQMLVGDKLNSIKLSTVAIFGLGGVGSYIAETLARSGVGRLVLIDNDVICESNVNRQLYALHSTVGKLKTEVAKQRILDINPNCEVETFSVFVDGESIALLDFTRFDAVADAVDNVTAKILIAEKCRDAEVYLVSSMGTGNKLDAQLVKFCDLFETQMCPLAKVMRRELKKRGFTSLNVVFSEEEPKRPTVKTSMGKQTPSSAVFVPAVAGCLAANKIFLHLLDDKEIKREAK